MEAWRVYQHLFGRTVHSFSLEGLVLQEIAEADPERFRDVVARLDVILDTLHPLERSAHAQGAQTRHHG